MTYFTIVNHIYFLTESEEDVLRHNPEIAQMLGVSLKYIPFLLILLSKAVFDHIPGKLNKFLLNCLFKHD